jgi:hypothetical protein
MVVKIRQFVREFGPMNDTVEAKASLAAILGTTASLVEAVTDTMCRNLDGKIVLV